MKKYFIAGGAAIAVFSISAFAASLQVNAGTLQTGVDMDLDCAEAANVLAWGYNDTPVGPAQAGTAQYVVIDLDGAGDCDNGEELHVVAVDENGNQVARGRVAGDATPPHLINGSNGPFKFELGNADASEIDGIRIGIDQGWDNYSY